MADRVAPETFRVVEVSTRQKDVKGGLSQIQIYEAVLRHQESCQFEQKPRSGSSTAHYRNHKRVSVPDERQDGAACSDSHSSK
jgi:hypothetical protein